MFRQFIYFLRTYSAINTNVSHIYVYTCMYVCIYVSYEYKNIHTHECVYLIVIIKLYFRHGGEFY